MFQTPALFASYRPAMSLWAASRPLPPPPARVIDAVLQHGDVELEREDGLVGIELSTHAMDALGHWGLSGEELGRARDLTLLWDPREEQLVQVLDRAPLRNRDVGSLDDTTYAAARQHGYPRLAPRDHRRLAA